MVPFSAPYEAEIATAIARSEKFVFVISPDSLDSGPCTTELAEAVQSSKQVIPLLRRQARDGQPIAAAVAERNWIFFDDDARFEASLAELIQTLDTDLDWVKSHTRLLVRAREWTEGSGDRSRLLRGRDLRAAEAWLAEEGAHPQSPPTSDQRAFIAVSRRSADRVAWLQRSVLAVGLVIAVVLASVALVQRNQAIHQRNLAVYNQTVVEGLEFGSGNIPLSAQLNLAAYHMRPGDVLASRLLSTENTPLSAPLASGTKSVSSVAYGPDGHTLVSADEDGTVRLWNVADPGHPRALGQPLTSPHPVTAVAIRSDGSVLATGDTYGEFRLRDITNPAHPRLLGVPFELSSAALYSMAFSRDGRILAGSDESGTVWLWDTADLLHPRLLNRLLNGGNGTVYSVAFSPDGRTMATGTNSGLSWLWDVADPAHPRLLSELRTGGSGQVLSLAFSPNGRTLAGSKNDGTVWLWDAADPSHPSLIGRP